MAEAAVIGVGTRPAIDAVLTMCPWPWATIRGVYDEPTPQDGARILVDRLWPRVLSKEKAALDEWCEAIAPSTELRPWYGHEPDRFKEFSRRYRAELERGEQSDALINLRDVAKTQTVTLLTATKHPEISEAVKGDIQ